MNAHSMWLDGDNIQGFLGLYWGHTGMIGYIGVILEYWKRKWKLL